MSIDFAPTFYPSEKEFENFHDYVFKLEKEYSKDYGIVQVIFILYLIK